MNRLTLDPDVGQARPARIALGKGQLDVIAHRTRFDRLKLDDHRALRIEVRARDRLRELAVGPSSSDLDRIQRRLINHLTLVEPEDQFLGSDIPDVTIP